MKLFSNAALNGVTVSHFGKELFTYGDDDDSLITVLPGVTWVTVKGFNGGILVGHNGVNVIFLDSHDLGPDIHVDAKGCVHFMEVKND